MSASHVQQNQPRGSRPVQRDPDLWFFDGNVVLVAQGILAFRVHKGVLAHHSEVFKSWFTGVAPPPSHGTIELCEGAQVVRLRVNDTAHDVKQALLVIYGLRYVHCTVMSVARPQGNADSISIVGGCQ